MPDKKTLTTAGSITSASGGAGKTLSTIQAYRYASVDVIEIGYSDSTSTIIKISQRGIEVGGTNEVGTGTVIAR